MKCIAYHLATGHRCNGSIGRSSSAQRLKLCAVHNKSRWLCFLATCMSPAHRQRLSRGEWRDHTAIVRTEVRRAVASFGSETSTAVLAAVANVPDTGNLDTYLEAVMAVVVPLLTRRVAVIEEEARVLGARADALCRENDAMVAQHELLRSWPTHTLTVH
jgi:hypothetical protein